MSTWKGCEPELLKALGVSNSTANHAFLTGWANKNGTSCKDNPLASVVKLSGSSNCTHFTGSLYVQAYTSEAQGIAATVRQLNEVKYASILGALKSGDPILYPDWQIVVGELGTWGAHAFAVQYGTAAQAAQAAVGGGGSIADDASRSLAGYKHFSSQLVHTVPQQIRLSQRLRARALAKLRA